MEIIEIGRRPTALQPFALTEGSKVIPRLSIDAMRLVIEFLDDHRDFPRVNRASYQFMVEKYGSSPKLHHILTRIRLIWDRRALETFAPELSAVLHAPLPRRSMPRIFKRVQADIDSLLSLLDRKTQLPIFCPDNGNRVAALGATAFLLRDRTDQTAFETLFRETIGNIVEEREPDLFIMHSLLLHPESGALSQELVTRAFDALLYAEEIEYSFKWAALELLLTLPGAKSIPPEGEISIGAGLHLAVDSKQWQLVPLLLTLPQAHLISSLIFVNAFSEALQSSEEATARLIYSALPPHITRGGENFYKIFLDAVCYGDKEIVEAILIRARENRALLPRNVLEKALWYAKEEHHKPIEQALRRFLGLGPPTTLPA
ncbi:MAG: hypothetical protein JSR76_03140 [Verrucomicrobia bacterium]|nr:hypothetical protein [Verrucomicrobiota bacterium]